MRGRFSSKIVLANPEIQIPNPKETPIFNIQKRINRAHSGFSFLNLSLRFGNWDLELNLRRRFQRRGPSGPFRRAAEQAATDSPRPRSGRGGPDNFGSSPSNQNVLHSPTAQL